MGRLGVVIVGVGGAVATTVILGVELMKKNLVPRRGMLTEPVATGMPASPLTRLVDFAPLEDMVFGGWDINPQNLYAGALQHGVLPPHQIAPVRETAEQIAPWPAIFKNEYSTNMRGDHVVKATSFREQIKCVVADIEAFKAKHRVERVVMVNLASTESWIADAAVHKTLAAFEAGLDANDPSISPAARYFYAANKAHAAYVNFSPGPTSLALTEHAEECGNPFGGSDGKTGQTLVKTALRRHVPRSPAQDPGLVLGELPRQQRRPLSRGTWFEQDEGPLEVDGARRGRRHAPGRKPPAVHIPPITSLAAMRRRLGTTSTSRVSRASPCR